MILDTLNEHLETLASHVFDNDKLVTYKWLSKELQIHVNVAKQILWEFYQKYHKSNDIECTYLLIGFLKNEGMRVEIVKQSDIIKAKEKFSKIMSEHLYSVHKPLVDLELLANSGSGDINYSAIKCNACKERSDEEMQLLRWGPAAKKTATENTINSKSTNVISLPKTEKNSVVVKKNKFNSLFNISEKSKSPEKSKSSQDNHDNDSMKKDDHFLKEKYSVKNINLTEKDQVSTAQINSREKGIEKQNKDSVQKDKNSAEKIQNSIEKNKNSKANSTTKKSSAHNNPMKKESLDNFFGKLTSSSKSVEKAVSENKNGITKVISTEKKTNKGKKNLHGKKRNRSEEKDEIAKKRKRIILQNDSSDSEIQSDVEMEEFVPETEQVSEALTKLKSPSPQVKLENGKKKMLKLVNRTYKEGEYIVTKKEHVYVSCSEDEGEKEEEMRKKEKKAEIKTEKIKKKQSTLMHFFKRS